MKGSRYPNISWIRADNPLVKLSVLKSAFPSSYLDYLENLVKRLRKNHVLRLRQKMRDATDLNKLQSVVSELSIAEVLVLNGKKVALLADNPKGWTGQTPDMIATDAFGSVYVEVKRITETEISDLIFRWMRMNLANRPLLMTVTLSPFLSRPYFRSRDRGRQRRALYKELKLFRRRFNPSEPSVVRTRNIVFEPTRDRLGNGQAIIQFAPLWGDRFIVRKLKCDALEKAKKRRSWRSTFPHIPYVIAFDSEELMFDDVSVDVAFNGLPTELHPTVPTGYAVKDVSNLPKVLTAVKRGWGNYLRTEGIIYDPSSRTFLPRKKRLYGLFLSSWRMGNVAAIIVRRSRDIHFRPNPFAWADLNRPNFVSYLPKNFTV